MTCIFEQLFLPSREGGNLTTQVPATWKPLIYHAAAAGSLYSAAHTRMRRRRLFKLSLILILGVDERPSLLNGFCPLVRLGLVIVDLCNLLLQKSAVSVTHFRRV